MAKITTADCVSAIVDIDKLAKDKQFSDIDKYLTSYMECNELKILFALLTITNRFKDKLEKRKELYDKTLDILTQSYGNVEKAKKNLIGLE